MIDGPRRTALEEMYAARLKDERTLRCLRKYYMSVDPANFNDTVEPAPYYPAIDRALHEGYRWEPEERSPWVLWCGTIAPSIMDRYLKGQPWHRRLWRYLRALWRGVVALFSFRGRFWWAEEDE